MTQFVAISMMLVLAMAGAAPCNVEENGECVAEQSAVSLLQGKITMKKDGATVDDEDGLDDEGDRALLTQRDTGRRRRKGGVKKVVRKARRAVRRAVRAVRKALPSFSKVFNDLKRKIGKNMNIIPRCSSVNDCVRKITKMASSALGNFFGKQLSKFSKRTMDAMTRNVRPAQKAVNGAMKQGEKVVKDVSKTATSIAKQVAGAFRGIKRFRLGRMCLSGNRALWYSKPTDCGAFSEIGRIITGRGNLNTALSRFRKCAGFKGPAFNIPTPFFETKYVSVCMPSWIQTPIEYILGALKAVGNGLARLIKQGISKVQNFAKKNLGLVQIGKAIHKRRAFPEMSHQEVAKAVMLEEESGEDGGACGHQHNWGVMITVGFKASLAGTDADPQISGHFGVGVRAEIGMFVGCRRNRLVAPQPVFNFALAYIHYSSAPVKSGRASLGFDFNLVYSDLYPAFPIGRQVKIAGMFAFALKGKKPFGIPVALGIGLVFPLPSLAPKGFAFKIGPFAFEKLLLEEEEKTTTSSVLTEEEKEHPVLHSVAKGLNDLEEIGELDQQVGEMLIGEGSLQEQFIQTALIVDGQTPEIIRKVHGESQPEALLETAKNGEEIELDFEVGGAVALSLCLHFPCK